VNSNEWGKTLDLDQGWKVDLDYFFDEDNVSNKIKNNYDRSLEEEKS
jgi:hypothetical protein